MPRKFIKRFMPDHEVIKRQKALKIFGNVLYNPNLWCLNRRSAAGAFAVGLFMLPNAEPLCWHESRYCQHRSARHDSIHRYSLCLSLLRKPMSWRLR